MAENFYTMLTKIGRNKLSNSAVSGSQVNFKTLKLGDGNGAYYQPSEDQTSLVKEVWSGNISSISVDEANANWIIVETVIPAANGGFFIREAGIFDEDGDMIAVSKLAETYKPVVSEGSTKDLIIKIVLEVSNASSIALKVDANIAVATKNDIQVLESKFQDISAQLSDIANKEKIYPTTNIGNAYSVTVPNLTALTDGYPLTVKFNAISTGAITVNPNGLGAKSIVDYFGNPVTNVRDKLIANLRYEATNGNFILLGKGGGGDAISNDLRLGKKATTDSGPIVGALDLSNVIPENLKEGVTVDGVTGNVNIHSLGGYQVGDSFKETQVIQGGKQIRTDNTTVNAGSGGRIAVDNDGNVYISMGGYLCKLNKNGVIVYGVYNSTYFGQITNIYYNPVEDTIWAFKSGTVTKWDKTTGSQIGSAVTVTTTTNSDMVLDMQGNAYILVLSVGIYKYDKNLNPVWFISDTQCDHYLTINCDGNAIFYAYKTTSYYTGIKCYSTEGSLLWSATSNSITSAALSLIYLSADNNGYIYSTASDMILRKIGRSGDVWQYSYYMDYGSLCAILTDSEGCTYGLTNNTNITERIYKWNANGELIWTCYIGGAYAQSNDLGISKDEGTIYTGNNLGVHVINARTKIIA